MGLLAQTPTQLYQQNLNAKPVIANSKQQLFKQLVENTASKLVLISEYHSKLGKHELYQQFYLDKPIYGAYLKINTNLKGQVISSFKTLINPKEYEVEIEYAKQTCWVAANGILQAATVKNIPEKTYYNQAGALLLKEITSLNFTDTIIKTKVFNPDPLTTSGVTYGQNGTYKNFNDSDYVLLNQERIWGDVPGRLVNDSFRFESGFYKIEDLKPPFYGVPVAQTDSIDYTRNNNLFEAAMAAYHIGKARKYFDDLGFADVANYQLKIDPHSGFGENSSFDFAPDTSLNFGLGGVNDAEDADVIVHEYSHAISHSLNADGIISTERRALEEGIADAFTCAYSKRINPFNWKQVFNWDGHNEFWRGRNGDSQKRYSQKIGDVYNDSEIWSSAMNNIIDVIGEDETLKLMYASIPFITPNTTMPQMAEQMFLADSILNQKKNQWILAQEFNYREFGTFYSGVNHISILPQFKLTNSIGFAQGTGMVGFEFEQNETIEIEVYTLQGKLVSKKQSQKSVYLNPNEFSSGVYLVKLWHNQTPYFVKLQRY